MADADVSIVERLAAKWATHSLRSDVPPPSSEGDARWWLRAIAEELEAEAQAVEEKAIGPYAQNYLRFSAVAPDRSRYRGLARWLREQADKGEG